MFSYENFRMNSPNKSSGDVNRPKRKITEYLGTSQPSTPKRSMKEEHEDGEDDVEDVEIESENESIAVQEGTLLPPKHVLKFKTAFDEHLKLSKHSNTSAKQLRKLATEFANTTDFKDKERLVASLLHYMRQSIRMGALNIGTALQATEEFLAKGSSVQVFPDFPKRPPTASYYYGKDKKMAVSVSNIKMVSERMNGDPDGKEKAEKTVEDAEKKYLAELEAFLESHRELGDLTKAQSEHVQKMIVNKKKKLYPQRKLSMSGARASGKSSNRKDSAKPRTAFDVFVQANPQLYIEHSPEKRTRKLQKKFDKLDEMTRNMLINIALSN